MGCVPYEPDYRCCEEWAEYDYDLQQRATALAWTSLRHLTGGQVGNCPVALRPCRKRCAPTGMAPFTPLLDNNRWFNVVCGGCGASNCDCGEVCEILLPTSVARIEGIYEGGALMPPQGYRVDLPNRLVRQDGGCWPVCQDMSKPWNHEDALLVTYTPGVWPGPDGLWAAGVLACEFAKACSGGKCRLPSSVTSVARQGVSMQFTEGMFAGGVAGIREVDAYVKSINPYGLARP